MRLGGAGVEDWDQDPGAQGPGARGMRSVHLLLPRLQELSTRLRGTGVAGLQSERAEHQGR